MLDPDLDKYRRIDPRAIVNASLDTIAGGIPDDIRADYLACYEGDRYVESMRYVRALPRGAARARRAAAADHDAGHDHQRPPRPRRSGRQRASSSTSGCPTAASRLIDAGHFVWEEAPAEYAAIILDVDRRGSSLMTVGPQLDQPHHRETRARRGGGRRASPTAASAAPPGCRS